MSDVLFLSRADVASLLSLDDCIAAVERAFSMLGRGELPPPAIAGVHAAGGAFHIKAAIAGGRFAAKINANFFEAVPRIKGVVVLADAANGAPLAVMDSIEITILRTGAATAVAAKVLARRDSRTAVICGCGNQGRVQLRALTRILQLEKVFAWDLDPARAAAFTAEMSRELEIDVSPEDLAAAVPQSDVCVTCTPARTPFLRREWLRPGTFVAAVGADSPEKQELESSILGSSKVVVDILEQCAAIGELHHAPRSAVHAELGEIVAGRK